MIQPTENPFHHPNVMISSTIRDLPDHREQAKDACLRTSFFPVMMEQSPAAPRDAVTESLRLVESAPVYIGIYAHRYGFVPEDDAINPDRISVTEMEYLHAKKLGKERLIFVMHDDHPMKSGDIDKGDKAAKLQAFKDRVMGENIVQFFKSPEDLRAHIVQSLAQSEHRVKANAAALHRDTDIPAAPEPYIAHPYVLLSAAQLVGRQRELNLLTDWVAKPSSPLHRARMLHIVAIGGMGKSALTWKWFTEIAPLEMPTLAGRIWWSFYESDAHFENFVIRTLAYVSGQPREAITQLPPPEREQQLIDHLNSKPFLLVMDGLERILIAYAKMDAAHLMDDDVDERTANRVAGALGLPPSAADSFIGQHQLRKTADVRAGQFLRKLAGVQQSRILVSTRLYPADVQMITGDPLPGCSAVFLPGLTDDDAVDLWRRMGVSGTREHLLHLFKQFDNYPLLIRALAGEVARYRRAPGNFDEWIAHNPDFGRVLANLRSEDRKAHVMEYALRGLKPAEKQVLDTIAAFRMPATYNTLAALFVEGAAQPIELEDDDEFDSEDEEAPPAPKLFTTEPELDAVLDTLEDRGLVGWDRIANRYDLHPIVRAVTWGGVQPDQQRGIYSTISDHFTPIAQNVPDGLHVESYDDLTPAVELYNALVGMEQYDAAIELFRDRINHATLYRLSAARQRADLLERLFPDGVDSPPRLTEKAWQAWTLNSLALAYQNSGQPGRAVPLFRMNIDIRTQNGDQPTVGLYNLADASRLSGSLRLSESSARRALILSREANDRFQEAISLYWLGLARLARAGAEPDPLYVGTGAALRHSLRLFTEDNNQQSEGLVNTCLSEWALAGGEGEAFAARGYADRAWELAQVARYEGDFIRAAVRQGCAALTLNDLSTADERLHLALVRARAVNLAEEELPALIALARLALVRGDVPLARELLDQVWEGAERGPYPMIHADALNLLAEIERGAGNKDAAVEAATKAYRLAWCDGISRDGQEVWAYMRGLNAAKAHLIALGAPVPTLPPFDPSAWEPLPEVEIDPE